MTSSHLTTTVLVVDEFLNCVMRQFAAIAALFDPSEPKTRIRAHEIVGAAGTLLELPCDDLFSFVDVPCEDGRSQTERRIAT